MLPKPNGVTIRNVSSDSFIFSWNNVNLATSYVIAISPKSEKTFEAQSTKFTITIKAKSSISESDIVIINEDNT